MLRNILRVLVPVLTLAIYSISCNGHASSDSFNPATGRMAAQVGIPETTEGSSGGVLPNIKPMVEASIIAAANTETVNVKTAARTYLVDHPSISPLSSDALWPGYTNALPKARYRFDPVSLQITGVYSISGGWVNIVFSLSQQKWREGTPDNDHLEDQDIP
jgi:hypothetical protein